MVVKGSGGPRWRSRLIDVGRTRSTGRPMRYAGKNRWILLSFFFKQTPVERLCKTQ